MKTLESALNVKEKLSEAQAFEIIIEIANEFKMLSLDEFVYCFKKAKLGYYGKDYNRLDILSISTWLRTYKDSGERAGMKAEIQSEVRKREHEKMKLEASIPPEDVAKHIGFVAKMIQKMAQEKSAGVKGFSQSAFHNYISENAHKMSDDEIKSLIKESKGKDDEAHRILSEEMESRKQNA